MKHSVVRCSPRHRRVGRGMLRLRERRGPPKDGGWRELSGPTSAGAGRRRRRGCIGRPRPVRHCVDRRHRGSRCRRYRPRRGPRSSSRSDRRPGRDRVAGTLRPGRRRRARLSRDTGHGGKGTRRRRPCRVDGRRHRGRSSSPGPRRRAAERALSVVIGAGFAPGLTCVLARHAGWTSTASPSPCGQVGHGRSRLRPSASPSARGPVALLARSVVERRAADRAASCAGSPIRSAARTATAAWAIRSCSSERSPTPNASPLASRRRGVID